MLEQNRNKITRKAVDSKILEIEHKQLTFFYTLEAEANHELIDATRALSEVFNDEVENSKRLN